MYQLLRFLNRYKSLVVFLVLESLALVITIRFYHFQRHVFFNNIGQLANVVNEKRITLSNYFSLKDKNEKLFIENKKLREEINKLHIQKKTNPALYNTTIDSIPYHYTLVKIINNSTTSKYNHITINKGLNDGIALEQGLINEKGIIGIVFQVSKNYGLALSLLNLKTKINARLKNNSYYGTLLWDGIDPKILQLEDLERQATIKIGDTIVTGGRSTIFPDGIPIGTIVDITSTNKSYEKIDIRPFNDMSSLEYAMVIKSKHKKEIQQLETKPLDEKSK